MRFTKPLLSGLIIVTAALSGCVSKPDLPLVPVDIKQPAAAYAWDLSGKILVKTPDDKVSTNLYWLHSPRRDEMRLTSMLGTSLMSMSVTPEETKLTADGDTYTDDDPQRLLYRLSGWSIPVDKLPLWLTGQFEGATVIKKDAQGRPSELLATGIQPWTIQVRSWQPDNPVLPRLMLVSRPGMELKVQINRWQALAPAAPAANSLPTNDQANTQS
ncbi:lipoprotein insertase outer membrane protein LolB [Shewanella submarina]|uniref:Outer-membrane lipoprotein LolB n=1 Tax=Shewanella submarina TaxID=2016376 RepID=A0ABV7GJ85_9GAMM|nr:lipoprotein insertase outer membrane protein LolB [Shewanella submarina]MCL1036019.1 lipoprotein insertase outer membrane protein LolB [Shewanella submarina]